MPSDSSISITVLLATYCHSFSVILFFLGIHIVLKIIIWLLFFVHPIKIHIYQLTRLST